jgi:Phage integrase SAM-like domain
MMPSPTFVQAAELLIKEAEVRVKLGENRPSLLRDYRQRLNAYCRPFFGSTRIDRVDRPKLREFRFYLAEKGLKTGTINPIMSFASKVLSHAEDERLIKEAPKAPRAKHRDAPRPAFSNADYKRLLEGLKKIETGKPEIVVKGAKIDWELRFIVTFLTNSFVRPGDIFVLQHKHVEECVADDGQPYLRLDYPASKGHAAAVITMPAAAKIYRRVVTQRSRTPGSDDYVFLPDRPNRTYAKELVRRQFTAALEHLNLKVTPKGDTRTLYSLRHTAITFRLLNAEDLDLLTLARNCRTSVEMIDRFYASSLMAEMNKDRLISFRRDTRHTGTD